MEFRKKPIVIEAVQWTGKNIAEIQVFMESDPPVYMNELRNADEVIGVQTNEGLMLAKINDWIIKEPFATSDRLFYPCKPDIFEQTYDKVTNG